MSWIFHANLNWPEDFTSFYFILFLLWILFLNWFYFFNIILQHWIDWKLSFVMFFFIWWSRCHDLGHEYQMLTYITIGLFLEKNLHQLFLIRFRPSILSLELICFCFIWGWPVLGHRFFMLTWIDSGYYIILFLYQIWFLFF